MYLFILGLIPIILFLLLLAVFKLSPLLSAYSSLIIALVLVMLVPTWNMPLLAVLSALLSGFAVALMPIGFVIIAAIFAYDISVKTGDIETIKKILGNITTDRRAQALLIAWGFGGFIEGIAGYGTAIAIPAAIMVSLGFKPLTAALICLIANTTPTAFGTVGLPVTTIANMTNLNVNHISFYTVCLLWVIMSVIPIILVIKNNEDTRFPSQGFRNGIIPVIIASVIAYSSQLWIARNVGAELPTIISSLLAMLLMTLAIKIFIRNDQYDVKHHVTLRQALMACFPYALMVFLIIGTSPLSVTIHQFLSATTITKIDFSFGHADWFNDTGSPVQSFKWLLAPVVPMMLAAVIAGLVQKLRMREIGSVLAKTISGKFSSILVIMGIVALSSVMRHSGMIQSIAEGLVMLMGSFFPLISPLLGTLGTFVTGSDLSSNLLFGPLQVEVAQRIAEGSVQFKELLIAANTAGATGGKMISPQNIAIAAATVGLLGREGDLLRITLKYALVYAAFLGVLVYMTTIFFL